MLCFNEKKCFENCKNNRVINNISHSAVKKAKGYDRYLLLVAFLYYAIFRDVLEQYVWGAKYLDEVISLLAIPVFVFRLRKNNFMVQWRREGYGRWILLFGIIGLISSIVYQYQDFVSVALLDFLLCVKFWLAIYVGKYIFGDMRLAKYAIRIYVHVMIITTLYMVLFALDWMFNLFDSEIRYGMRTTQLMYTTPTQFVSCCMFLIIILLSIREHISGDWFWLIILLFLMCTSLRSKAFGNAIAVIMIYYIVCYRKKKIKISNFFLFIPIVILVAWEQIEFYFFSSIQDDSARYQLLIKAFEIAKDCFPLGAGFGTYASHYSGVSYSPLYSMYGLTDVNGLRENATSFISDSFWPMILGQTGYLGLLAYSLGLVILFKTIQKLYNANLSIYASAISGFFYLLISSMAESAFVHPMAMPIAIWMGFSLGREKEYIR